MWSEIIGKLAHARGEKNTPGIVFVHLDNGRLWHKITTTSEVLALLLLTMDYGFEKITRSLSNCSLSIMTWG